MLIRIILILLLAMSVSAQTPIGLQKFQIDDTTFTMRFGGALQNYPDSAGVFQPIENDFVADGGSFIAHNALLKTTVDSVGNASVTLTRNGVIYNLTQTPVSLTRFKKSDSTWSHIDNTPNWNNISHNNNIVSWGNVYPGVDMWVKKDNGQVDYGIRFKPAFLNAMVDSLNNRPDSADIWIANISRFTLSGGIDNHDIPLGTVPKRVLKRWGGLVFQMGKQFLQYPGSDTLPGVPVFQRHIFIGGNLYVLELVKATELKRLHELFPTEPLWHNDSKTIDNDTDIEDSELLYGNADLNRGTVVTIRADNASGDEKSVILILKNMNDSLGTGVTIDSAFIFIRCAFTDGTVRDVYAYGIWKQSLLELQVTWNSYDAINEGSWSIAGCNDADDAGPFNQDDREADRKATAFATVGIETSGTFQKFTCGGWLQTCYDSSEDMAVNIQANEAVDEYFDSREVTTVAYRPYVEIYYSTGGGGADISHVRRIKLNEEESK